MTAPQTCAATSTVWDALLGQVHCDVEQSYPLPSEPWTSSSSVPAQETYARLFCVTVQASMVASQRMHAGGPDSTGCANIAATEIVHEHDNMTM